MPRSTSATSRRRRILQVPGAKDIAVEFTRLSKTYSMPGWRMGFAAGNPRLINALTRMKSYLDYGAFTPIQVAAAAALNGPQDCVDQMRALYRERRDVLIRGLARPAGTCRCPDGSMFAWAPIPPRFAELGSVEFSKLLLARAKVAVAPGLGFGEHGDGYVRIALVENTHRMRQAVRNIRGFLQAGDQRRPGRAAEGSVVAGMTQPLSVARRRPRHRRRRRPQAAARQCRDRRRARRPADRGRPRSRRATARATAACRCPACAGTTTRSRSPPIPAIDVVVELIGGSTARRVPWSQAALAAGKPVVTANKALLAVHGAALAALAEERGVAAGVRGRGRRRHPGDQGAARGPGRQPHRRASPAS